MSQALKISFAKNVSAYATASIDVSSIDIGDKAALVDLANNTAFSPDWGSSEEMRVVEIRDAAGSYIAGNMDLEKGEEVAHIGTFRFPGTEAVEVEFWAYEGASQSEKDAAFLAALAQIAEINYLAVGGGKVAA